MIQASSRLLFGFVVACLLLAPRSVEEADKWLSVRSKNFLLVGDASESRSTFKPTGSANSLGEPMLVEFVENIE